MKLTIGETWHKEREEYVEELKVDGIQAIEAPIPDGDVVVPKDGDSIIEVRVINNISAEWFTTKMTLRQLNDNWEQGEADL
jgi:hypothetical protein